MIGKHLVKLKTCLNLSLHAPQNHTKGRIGTILGGDVQGARQGDAGAQLESHHHAEVRQFAPLLLAVDGPDKKLSLRFGLGVGRCFLDRLHKPEPHILELVLQPTLILGGHDTAQIPALGVDGLIAK